MELVDQLLDNYVYSEIADILNEQGLRPGGSARRGLEADCFTAKRIASLAYRCGLSSRYDRLRDRGMLTTKEMAERLGIDELMLVRWARHGIVNAHAYNGHAFLYEDPGPNPPIKQCSRWNRLVERAAGIQKTAKGSQLPRIEPEEV